MPKNKILLLIGSIIIGLGFVLLQSKNNNLIQKTDSSKLTSIEIGVSQLRISLPIFVAKEQDIFKKNGLNVHFKLYNTAQPLMQALLEDKIHLAGYTALPIIYNGMQRSKKDLLFLTTMIEDTTHRISYLLKRKDSSLTNIKSLEGKKIGILPTIAYSAWIKEILKVNHVDLNSVTITPIAPVQQGASLLNKAVDALFTNDPVATTLIDKNVATLLSTDVDCPKYIMNPFPFGSFNIDKAWADKHTDIVQRVKKSLNEAIIFINTHPKEAKLMMKNYIPDTFKPYVSKYPDALYLTTTDSSDKIFNDVAKKYLEIGIIKKPLLLDGLTVD